MSCTALSALKVLVENKMAAIKYLKLSQIVLSPWLRSCEANALSIENTDTNNQGILEYDLVCDLLEMFK
jgi:hypothetical protein